LTAKIETSFDVPHQTTLKGIAALVLLHFHYRIEMTIACSFRNNELFLVYFATSTM